MDTSPQDVLVASGWSFRPVRKPAQPILITNEVLVVSRQAQPDTMIALPAEQAILTPSKALTGLVLGTIAIVSELWRIDMQFFTPVRLVLAIIFCSFALAGVLDVKYRERKFADRRKISPPIQQAYLKPELSLVA